MLYRAKGIYPLFWQAFACKGLSEDSARTPTERDG